ncbi:hypothetical protein Bca4012_099739 [Brassica carinata]|uniref:(rape) hypothetical protein n=1 Tax=Brassica napus TaxID=3708 RepID=A0A816QAE6_BRANA|nr:unnamed protein product [Brassica napus]
MNRFTGIVGVFNCQGAGWCKKTKKNRSHDTSPGTLTGLVRADVADLGSQVAGVGWSGVWRFNSTNKVLRKEIYFQEDQTKPRTLQISAKKHELGFDLQGSW